MPSCEVAVFADSNKSISLNKPHILFQDQDLVAVYKPAGIAVHRSALTRSDKSYLVQMIRNQIGRHVYPVHRLDKPVSGLIVFALNLEAAQQLATCFSSRLVRKTYVSVVRGYTDFSGTISHPLAPQVYARKQDQSPKPAVTTYLRMATVELPLPVSRYATSRYSLIRVWPVTGRRHQIRRHLKHINHPVIGDSTYGDGKHNRFFRNHFRSRRLLLASLELELNHPRTGHILRLSAPLDESFKKLIEQIF